MECVTYIICASIVSSAASACAHARAPYRISTRKEDACYIWNHSAIYRTMVYIIQENTWSSSNNTSQRMKRAASNVFLGDVASPSISYGGREGSADAAGRRPGRHWPNWAARPLDSLNWRNMFYRSVGRAQIMLRVRNNIAAS